MPKTTKRKRKVDPASRQPRWQRRPKSRRDEIASAGLRLFAARGYLDVSVDDIARAAGATKGAVYHHFDGKEDLLVAAVDLHFRRTFEDVAAGRISAAGRTATQRMEALLWGGWKLWHSPEFQGLFRLVVGDGGAAVPAVRERFLREGPHRGWTVLGALIKEGQENGEFRQGVDAEAAAKLIACGLVLQIMLKTLSNRRPRRTARGEFHLAFAQVVLMLENTNGRALKKNSARSPKRRS